MLTSVCTCNKWVLRMAPLSSPGSQSALLLTHTQPSRHSWASAGPAETAALLCSLQYQLSPFSSDSRHLAIPMPRHCDFCHLLNRTPLL